MAANSPARSCSRTSCSTWVILRIDSPDPFPVIAIGDFDALQVGDLVLAVYNPFGVGQTTTSGIVSALARSPCRRVRLRLLHPDRRGNQSRQFRRRADQHGRPAGRHQHGNLQPQRRLDRHRFRHPVQHGPRRRAGRGETGATISSGPMSARISRKSRRRSPKRSACRGRPARW